MIFSWMFSINSLDLVIFCVISSLVRLATCPGCALPLDLWQLALTTLNWINRRGWMDGWMDIQLSQKTATVVLAK